MMYSDAILIGVGQLGSVFARGLLRTYHRITPVLRGDSLDEALARTPDPQLILVAVGEEDLDEVLSVIPDAMHERLALIQNELLPPAWENLAAEPTVASIWFEKKAPTVAHAIQSTPVHGPSASRLIRAMEALDLPAHEVSKDELLSALVVKSLYILTANITGLILPGELTTGALWSEHREQAESVAMDVLKLQRARLGCLGETLDQTRLFSALGSAFLADPDHKARGRSAPARLKRALAAAEQLGLKLDNVNAIASESNS